MNKSNLNPTTVVRFLLISIRILCVAWFMHSWVHGFMVIDIILWKRQAIHVSPIIEFSIWIDTFCSIHLTLHTWHCRGNETKWIWSILAIFTFSSVLWIPIGRMNRVKVWNLSMYAQRPTSDARQHITMTIWSFSFREHPIPDRL